MKIKTIAVMCYCLRITQGTPHLRTNARNVRKDLQSVHLCVKTRRNGPQTFIVEGKDDETQQVIQRMGKLVTLGACDPENRIAPLSKRQKKMVKVCLKSEGKRITIRLPRVIRSEFKNLDATSGRCGGPFSWVEIKLDDEEMKDTSASADISGKWMAEQVKMGSSLETPLQGSPITMQFSETRISASAGCNRIFGGCLMESTLDESDNIIHLVKISTLASTRKLCHPLRIMEQERAFIKSMALKTFSYELNADNRLEFHEINDSDGEVSKGKLVAVFEPIDDSNV